MCNINSMLQKHVNLYETITGFTWILPTRYVRVSELNEVTNSGQTNLNK